MKNITYINAGAGSGKTYTLTQKLANLIEQKKIQPEQVILTTFTIKAANEFKEKAKAFLYEKGLYNEAIRLDQAMIGTVHSVANAFINKYWFYLGLTPDMGVMAEEDLTFYTSQSLAELPTDDELVKLHDFCRNFGIENRYNSEVKGLNYDFWRNDLNKIIAFTTNYEVNDYSQSEKESLEFIEQFVDPTANISFTTEELRQALEEHKQLLATQRQSAANNERILKLDKLARTVNHRTIDWYKKLNEIVRALKKHGPLIENVINQLTNIYHSQIVYDFQAEYIKILFSLARRWNTRFAEFKREKNLLDYNDMEKYMLQLMQIPELKKEIALSYNYLFVDEYQDCSPIQVKIFDQLSDMMEHSYWVGDYKQAIYGFRGSDITLTKAIVDRISTGENGCDTETLDTSWRSLPDIVNVCNETFSQTFSSVLDKANICLKQKRTADSNFKSLCYWDVSNGISTVEAQIAKLIENGAKPNEIAVLSRANKPLDKLASDLDNYSIPANRENVSILNLNATLLVEALLALIVSDRDTLAKSQIAFLTEKDFTTQALIEDKFQFDTDSENVQSEYLNNKELVNSLLNIREHLRQQSISAMVETLIIELDLYNVVKKWVNSTLSSSALDTIIKTARTYESHCLQMNMAASIDGFIKYLKESNPVGTGDANGVQLHTYHSCKGLQWKYVVLLSLKDNPASVKNIVKQDIYGVHFTHSEKPSATNPYPEVYIRVTPWIFGSANSNVPDDIEEHIERTELFKQVYQNAIAESNRLLYVGMTRPKDVLILTTEKTSSTISPLQWFKDIGLTQICVNEPSINNDWDCLGVGIPFANETIESEEELDSIEPYNGENQAYWQKRIPYNCTVCDAPARDILPSKISKKGETKSTHNFEARIPILKLGNNTMADVGNCIHQIYCGIESCNNDQQHTKQVVAAYGLSAILTDTDAIIRAWNNLTQWLIAEHGKAIATYHERPFMHSINGHNLTGSIDLVWRTTQGVILIDYKTCPMGSEVVLNPNSEHYAGWYAGQVESYTNALTANGEKVLKQYIYYPVSGLVVEL